MKKKALSFYCITVMLFCQVFLCFATVQALTNNQRDAISNNCEQIKNSLRTVQHEDSRARVYLGAAYETIRSKFMVPLNHRLVDNGIPAPDLVSNQAVFTAAQENFKDDFIDYQKTLEELVGSDCRSNPDAFYQTLESAREKRRIMVQDIAKLSEHIRNHLTLVNELKGKL